MVGAKEELVRNAVLGQSWISDNSLFLLMLVLIIITMNKKVIHFIFISIHNSSVNHNLHPR